MSTKLIVDCPTCKQGVPWVDSQTHRPFCSERCQQIDLGAWASEEYSIPVSNQEQWSEDDHDTPPILQ